MNCFDILRNKNCLSKMLHIVKMLELKSNNDYIDVRHIYFFLPRANLDDVTSVISCVFSVNLFVVCLFVCYCSCIASVSVQTCKRYQHIYVAKYANTRVKYTFKACLNSFNK